MFILREFRVRTIVLFITCYVLVYLHPEDKLLLILGFGSLFLIVEFIPSVIIHFQYLRYNGGTKLSIDTEQRVITIENHDSKVSFSYNQIKTIRLALMGDLHNGYQRGAASWISYHYAFVKTEDGRHFIITCLLINDLRKFFKDSGLKVTNDRVFFPTVRMARYKE